jgi:UDP-N-acetylmuramoylalanine--D-glutamate ligase
VTVRYNRGEPPAGGVGVRDGWVTADRIERLDAVGGGHAMTGPDGRVMPTGDIGLPGAHNVSNVLAAVAVGLVFGVAPDAIRTAVAEFRGVEHRLEYVTTVKGVRFVNDSQGTQPDAVIAALRSFEQPLILIAGGRTKNLAMDDLAPVVAERATAVVLIGETAEEFERLFVPAGARRVERAPDLPTAVGRAFEIARREVGGSAHTATVLLSPAATSFDMFVDYADRGRAFKAAVAMIAAQHGGER